MRKILLIIISLICSSTVLAAPKPTQDPNTVVCPATITCDYNAGTCNLPTGWSVSNYTFAFEPFSVQSLPLSEVRGGRDFANNSFSLYCWYNYGSVGAAGTSSYIMITIPVKKFVGTNWSFSGFGKSASYCPKGADPTTCAGEK